MSKYFAFRPFLLLALFCLFVRFSKLLIVG